MQQNQNPDPELFQLTQEGLQESQIKKALDSFSDYVNIQKGNFLGYQVNYNMEYETELGKFLNFHINNVGDPFISGNLTINSKIMETAVLEYYARLWNAKIPHNPEDPESYWGYTLSMGSTEGNLYGIWNARDYLSGQILLLDEETKKRLKLAKSQGKQKESVHSFLYQRAKFSQDNPNSYTPVVFYSQDTHYSVVKAMRILNMDTFYSIGSKIGKCPLLPSDFPKGYSEKYIGENGWPLEVPSDADGRIYVPALCKLVEFFVEKGYPIFVSFNMGTTFKGAYDPVEESVRELVKILKKYNMYEREITYNDHGIIKKSKRHGFWFHVDGALGSSYLPFLEKAQEQKLLSLPEGSSIPVFDFRIQDIQSITMSGHKWIGAPYPCGIFMTKIKYQLMPPDDPMYIGSPDTTFAGSRNGLAAMILWNYAAKHSYQTQIQKAIYTEKLAQFAYNKLKELEKELAMDLWVERSPLSLTIRFKRPIDDLVSKYSLSCEELCVENKKRKYSHIFTMEHVTEDLILRLIQDLKKEIVCTELSDSSHHNHVPLLGRGFK